MARKLLVGLAASALAVGALTTLGAPAVSAAEVRSAPVANNKVQPKDAVCDWYRTTDGHEAGGRCSDWPRYYLTAVACGPGHCTTVGGPVVSWPAWSIANAGSGYIDQRTIALHRA